MILEDRADLAAKSAKFPFGDTSGFAEAFLARSCENSRTDKQSTTEPSQLVPTGRTRVRACVRSFEEREKGR